MALLYVTKASNLCISCLDNKKQLETKRTVLKKRIVDALSKVVGFFRVLRFLPTRNIAG